jgi:hypothetical protein
MLSTAEALVLALIGFVTAVWGYRLARLWVSLVSGVALGYVFYLYSTPQLKATLTPVVLFILGFMAGAMIGFTVFKLAISALAGYALTRSLVSAGLFLADESSLIVLTVVFAMILYAVVDKMLPLVFALAGAALLFIALTEIHVPVILATVLAVLTLVIGLSFSFKHR